MTSVPDAAGQAALVICESLLLSLRDRNILPEREIIGLLQDAAAVYEAPPPSDGLADLHEAVAVIIRRLIPRGHPARLR